MSPQTGFLAFLLLTVALLCAVLWTGFKHKLPLHLVLVATTVASLGTAIYYAKQLGEIYDLEAAGVITPIHLTLAKVTTALYLLPVVTGVATLRNRGVRAIHRRAALFVVAMTLLSTATGALMLSRSVPL